MRRMNSYGMLLRTLPDSELGRVLTRAPRRVNETPPLRQRNETPSLRQQNPATACMWPKLSQGQHGLGLKSQQPADSVKSMQEGLIQTYDLGPVCSKTIVVMKNDST
jgi:hypothetical protein